MTLSMELRIMEVSLYYTSAVFYVIVISVFRIGYVDHDTVKM